MRPPSVLSHDVIGTTAPAGGGEGSFQGAAGMGLGVGARPGAAPAEGVGEAAAPAGVAVSAGAAEAAGPPPAPLGVACVLGGGGDPLGDMDGGGGSAGAVGDPAEIAVGGAGARASGWTPPYCPHAATSIATEAAASIRAFNEPPFVAATVRLTYPRRAGATTGRSGYAPC